MVRIAVLGAGVVGLSTATQIQERIPRSDVTIIADRFTKDTTSHGAGGIFLPRYESHPETPKERVRKWSQLSFEYYRSLVTGPDAGKAGGMIMSGVFLTRQPFPDPLYKDIVFSYRQLTDSELKKLNLDPTFKFGYQVTTFVINLDKYLPWLTNRFKDRGGSIIKRKIGDLSELVGLYDIVVNCTGLGSKELLTDEKMYPTRGLIIRVRAPWIKQWTYTEDMTVVMPGEELAALGTVKQKGRDDTEFLLAETEDILSRCTKLVPSVKDSVIDHEWIGIRPSRDPMRVETETLYFSNGSLKVVHNYGHSNDGIGLSWGTAVEATDLTLQSLADQMSKL